jgi:hypothetical protein
MRHEQLSRNALTREHSQRNRENNNVEFRTPNVEFRSAFHFCGSTFGIHYSKFFYQNSGEMHIPVFVKLLLPPRQSRGISQRIRDLFSAAH